MAKPLYTPNSVCRGGDGEYGRLKHCLSTEAVGKIIYVSQ